MKKLRHLKRFNESMEDKSISDLIGDEKVDYLKSIGWSDKEIYDIVNFLMISDDEIKNTKLTSLDGIPTNIKGSLEDTKLASLDGIASNIKGSLKDTKLTSLRGL